MKTIMIGLDLAKSVFQVHGVDAAGQVVIRRRLRRGQVLEVFAKLAPCVVGMEACSGAHYWARELRALGHEVRLMPPSYVKPYVKRNKTDGRDAEAICEAMQRPTMRFVAVKSIDQQAEMALHRSRALMVRQRTMAANALRGLFAEFGMVAAQGINGLRSLVQQLPTPAGIPAQACGALVSLARHWQALEEDIQALERQIVAALRNNEPGRRIMQIPGVGPLTASAVIASVGDMRQFRSGRSFAAWLGLTRASTTAEPSAAQAGSQNRASAICAACWSSALSRNCARNVAANTTHGSSNCCSAARPKSPRWHSPPRQRGSSGRCWPRAKPIALRCGLPLE
jgi:transposase